MGDAVVGAVAKGIADTLDREGIAFDIGAYRDAPPASGSGAAAPSNRPTSRPD